MKKISLIVPCFNEEESLKYLYDELKKQEEILTNYKFEYLFINDGSTDKTLDLLKSYSEQDKNVKYISFSRNFGKEAAMYAGFCNATGDYVSIMDADLQDPPSLLPKMLEILETGEYDSVATRRKTRKGEPKLRSLFARLFYKIINKMSDADIVDGARDYRLMSRQMVNSIIKMTEHDRFSKGIFGWIGFKTYWLEFENVERVAGKTKWNAFKLAKYAFDGIISFSNFPLKLAYIFSGFFSINFLVCLIAAIINLSINWECPLWLTLCTVISFFLIFVFLFLGILGSYLGKIYNNSKNRPQYIIRDTNMDDAN